MRALLPKSLLLQLALVLAPAVLTAAPLTSAMEPPTGMPGFCGKVDFRTIPNEGLEFIVTNNDLMNKRRLQRQQCGLPNEKLSLCSACNEDFPESSLKVLRPLLASKSHSDWHAKWHKIRVGEQSIDEAMFQKLQAAGLTPKELSRDEFFDAYSVKGKLAGENFFYMHRMMIKMVQFELAMNGLPCVKAWQNLPARVDDKLWPVPHDYKNEQAKAADQAKLEAFRKTIASFQQESFLKKISLNDLGRALEPSWHQALHGFYRDSKGCTPEAKAQGVCDDLVPVETSPANKHFWKIHGMIDELMGRWLTANDYSEISADCSGRANCYTWQATWVGKYPQQ